MPEVIVVGSGIIGVSSAVWLQRMGADVTLVDRIGPASGASFGNAGVLASCAIVPVTTPGLIKKAPGMLFHPESPLFLKWSYLPIIAPWLLRFLSHANFDDASRIANALSSLISDSLPQHQELASGSVSETLIIPMDYWYLYPNKADFEADSFGWQLRATNGFEWDHFDLDKIYNEDPALKGLSKGYAISIGNHGRIINPENYVKGLVSLFVEKGGKLLRGDTRRIAVNKSGTVSPVIDGKTFACSSLVLAGGAWSGSLLRGLGVRIPMNTERGYHIEIWNPNLMPIRSMMITAHKAVMTPMNNRLRLAGIVEFGGLRLGPSRKPLRLLRKCLNEILPDIKYDSITEWLGFRPTVSDSLPVIGPVSDFKNLYVAFGHHHIGLTAGAKTGKLVSELVIGKSPSADVGVFSPDRFIYRQ